MRTALAVAPIVFSSQLDAASVTSMHENFSDREVEYLMMFAPAGTGCQLK
jgi:hypothetical protein